MWYGEDDYDDDSDADNNWLYGREDDDGDDDDNDDDDWLYCGNCGDGDDDDDDDGDNGDDVSDDNADDNDDDNDDDNWLYCGNCGLSGRLIPSSNYGTLRHKMAETLERSLHSIII